MGKVRWGSLPVLLLIVFLITGSENVVWAADEKPDIRVVEVTPGVPLISEEESDMRTTKSETLIAEETLPAGSVTSQPVETGQVEIVVQGGITILIKDPEHLTVTVPGEFLKAEEIHQGIFKMPRYTVQYRKESGEEIATQLDFNEIRDVDEVGNTIVISSKPDIIWQGSGKKAADLVSSE